MEVISSEFRKPFSTYRDLCPPNPPAVVLEPTVLNYFLGFATVVSHSHALSHKSDTQEVQVCSNLNICWIYETLLILHCCTIVLVTYSDSSRVVQPGHEYTWTMHTGTGCPAWHVGEDTKGIPPAKHCSVWGKSNSTRVTCVLMFIMIMVLSLYC